LWGSDCERSPALIEYQNRIQNENKGLDRLGYTQMWEEELGRRFNATAFLPLEPGHTLQRGKLKVIRQLAFGGLSAIYLVQKEELDMFVLKEAVVPLDADADQRSHAEQHLKRESEMLFCLYHPNIAHVIDYFVEDDRNYLLLEYVNGQDLRQFVKQNGPQSEAKVAQWAMQVARALQFVHSQTPPVIHRDVTPDNMVLKNDGTLVLIDFGAANEFLGTATGTLVQHGRTCS
jgi:serine/threonine-protein kinase